MPTLINAIFMIIDEKITDFMLAADMFYPGKFKVSSVPVSFTTTREVNGDYFMNIINKSFEHFKDHPDSLRIGAIRWNDTVFYHDDVKSISDGKKEFFLVEKK